MKKTILSLAVVVSLGLGATACGGGGDDRPSKDELIETFTTEAEMDDETAGCVADSVLESDLSDEQLRALADADEDAVSEEDQEEIGAAFMAAAQECVAG